MRSQKFLTPAVITSFALLLAAVWLGYKCVAFSRDYSLWDAARGGDRRTILRLLDQGANPDASWQGLTALGAAAFAGEADTAQLLLGHGADPRKAWRQALHQDRPVILRAMLAHGLSPRGEECREAMLMALHAGYADDVAVLLRAGIDPDITEPRTGRTALQVAQHCPDAPSRHRMTLLLQAAKAGQSVSK